MSPIFTGSGFGYRRRSDSNLLFLLHMDGSNDSTTFIDSSTNNIPVTATTAKISTAQSKFGGSSALINGGSLQTPVNQALSLGTQDYTVEGWIYLTIGDSGGYNTIFIIASNNGNFSELRFGDSGFGHRLQFNTGVTSSDVCGFQITKSSFTNTWKHFALIRQSGQIYLYINGIQIFRSTGGSELGTTVSHNLSGNVYMIIGNGSGAFSGYIDEFRISPFARYPTITNFTIPTEEFSSSSDPYFSNVSLLLNMNGTNGSTTFTDSSSTFTLTPSGNAQISTTQSKFGGASGYFDGSGDYLTCSTGTGLDFGTGDFTIEAWVYITSLGTYHPILEGRTSASFSNYVFGINNVSGTLRLDFVNAGGGAGRTASTTSVPLNTWTHVAWIRAGGVTSYYVNGVKDATTNSYSGSLNPNRTQVQIGAVIDPQYFYGYIDDLRITKGVARYLSNFTVPTSPFPDP